MVRSVVCCLPTGCRRFLSSSPDIKEQVRSIEKAVNAKEPRFILRVLRGLATTRKRLSENVIRRLVQFYYGSNSSEREVLLGFIQSPAQVLSSLVKNARHRFSRSQWISTWKSPVHQHQPVTNRSSHVPKRREPVLPRCPKWICTFTWLFFSI